MNDTLSKIRAKAEHASDSQVTQQQTQQVAAAIRARAAAPLFAAFNDIKNEFVRVDLLKQIWPTDFDRRNDRVIGLVIEIIGGDAHPCGLKLQIPGGHRSFAVELAADGSIAYTSTREAQGGRPQYITFQNETQWMEFFYKTMAYILEV
ncbi:hypothetical protein HUU62_09690 [Rhodoferax sp. 4810]|uniref:Uncharacterized protein n=1 Tax=Thiospirillum jenense TaxID=1653858 RepID=A0A839HDK9_9GAMM|nr:hypothetical protein [Thiospirillum jenense]MBB1074680.1 hypothetical protein [Rhodoferax jenense]MBB1125476.1 hypothetical protein [Thiospirillum jenense]